MMLDKWLLRGAITAAVITLGVMGYQAWEWRKLDGIEGRHDDAKQEFQQAETVYIEGRDRVIALRDTLVITDTVQVKEFVRACTSALNACDSAMVKARTAIATGDSVITKLKRGPFLESYGAVLYDPVARIPTARIGVAVKPRGKVSLLLEVEQRMEPGESPRFNAGLKVRF